MSLLERLDRTSRLSRRCFGRLVSVSSQTLSLDIILLMYNPGFSWYSLTEQIKMNE